MNKHILKQTAIPWGGGRYKTGWYVMTNDLFVDFFIKLDEAERLIANLEDAEAPKGD